jgi:hypothetical protein
MRLFSAVDRIIAQARRTRKHQACQLRPPVTPNGKFQTLTRLAEVGFI